MSWFPLARRSPSESEKWLEYLRDRILGAQCRVCGEPLDSQHTVAQLGACIFSGDPLTGGFLREVQTRDWAQVAQPFLHISGQDVMACEMIRCPSSGAELVVWVELKTLTSIDQAVLFREKLTASEASEIEEVNRPSWLPFPDRRA